MRRSGRLALGLVLAVSLIVALAVWGTSRGTDDTGRTISGFYSPAESLAVANLTIVDGTYRVGYSMDVLYSPQLAGSVLRCSLVDTSGLIEFFGPGVQEVQAGLWTTVNYDNVFDLPDLTLGIRCKPSNGTVLTAVFRNVDLFAQPVSRIDR